MTQQGMQRLTSTATVARSAVWNILGRAGPLLIAIAVTPRLVVLLGPSRWGVFTIALSLVGIFGIFDFGIGRALTRMIAERTADGRDDEASNLVLSGLIALTGLGVVGGLVVGGLVGYWTDHLGNIPPELQSEVRTSLYLLSASAPLVLLNSALWGVIAAYQRFWIANLVNIPIMAMYYIGPWISLNVFDSLVGVIAVLVGCRIVMTVAYWRISTNAMPSLRHARFSFGELPALLTFGGWMTISNLAFPILNYVDRFVIGSVLSAAATGYYSTPLDLVTRFSVLTVAVMNTVYPAMAASFRADPDTTVALFRRALLVIAVSLFLPCLFVTGFSREILTLWLGADFSAHAAQVLCLMGFGIFVSSLDSVAAGLLDGIGRPDISAKLSLLEIVIYVPALTVLVREFGIDGAAMAWLARCVIDFAARLLLVGRVYLPVQAVARRIGPLLALGLALMAVPLATSSEWARPGLGLLVFAIFMILLWLTVVKPAERDAVRVRLRVVLRLGRPRASESI